VIEREKRDLAARLVREFLEGVITSYELEDAWPSSKADRALDAVGWEVWHFYDDLRPRRLTGNQAASPGERKLLNRYAAFLDSEIAYDWPKAVFWRFWLRRKHDAQMEAHGDLSVWPFTSREQWAKHVQPQAD